MVSELVSCTVVVGPSTPAEGDPLTLGSETGPDIGRVGGGVTTEAGGDGEPSPPCPARAVGCETGAATGVVDLPFPKDANAQIARPMMTSGSFERRRRRR